MRTVKSTGECTCISITHDIKLCFSVETVYYWCELSSVVLDDTAVMIKVPMRGLKISNINTLNLPRNIFPSEQADEDQVGLTPAADQLWIAALADRPDSSETCESGRRPENVLVSEQTHNKVQTNRSEWRQQAGVTALWQNVNLLQAKRQWASSNPLKRGTRICLPSGINIYGDDTIYW